MRKAVRQPRVKSQASNPFCADRLRPGAIDYIFVDGTNITDLLHKLRESNWRGEIVGPHGTGKSTLIQTLLPKLANEEFNVRLGTFRGGAFHWASEGAATNGSTHLREIVVIDGFEQLSPLARWKWKWLTRWRRQGLLVTSHRSVGLPRLLTSNVNCDLARQVVQQIAGEEMAGLTADDVDAALDQADGNLRDAMFRLYDVFEETLASQPETM
mgnify:CR=1 FL=1